MFYRFYIILFLFHSQTLLSAVLVKENLWPQNSLLNVVFLDGSTKAKSLVKAYSVLWVENTNLSLRFYSSIDQAPEVTHIRISFKHHTGSQLGNQRDHLSKKATMNLFALISHQISDLGAKRLILHEFGHALGLEHEYLSPNWPYGLLAKSAVMSKCLPKMVFIGYSKLGAEKHCTFINSQLKSKSVLSTAYDESSIMSYALSFLGSNNSMVNIQAQTKLSYLDRYAIQMWYPKN